MPADEAAADATQIANRESSVSVNIQREYAAGSFQIL
jgi:hypothetical protein